MNISCRLLTLFFILITGVSSFAQIPEGKSEENQIRLNQIGFYTQGPKKAVIVSPDATEFAILSADGKNELYSGKLSEAKEWPHSKEVVKQADFSAFDKPGKYVLHVPGIGNGYAFEIGEDVHLEPARASLKAFYFQRASAELPEEYAGKWAREAGHPDAEVKVHNSAASNTRPSGSIISSARGWYDAGDYNKYIVNSGITMGTLFSLYEDFPQYMDTLNLNIPESDNAIPDILDETLYNLRWMMTMQDEDGGVYHKMTTAEFEGAVLPKDATNQRWVVQKSTAATLDFAAVTAQGSRIFSKYLNEYPGLSDSLLVMSESAYNWAKENPDVAYVQDKLEDPEINTGAYGDRNFKDEFQWAATELFITTGNEDYYRDADIESAPGNDFSIPTWPNVNTLALYSLLRNKEKFADSEVVDIKAVVNKITEMADELVTYSKASAYGTPMGTKASNFAWGSNSVAANQGILLLNAYSATGDKEYLDAAIDNLDYLLGRNATGFSFLTGYGEKSTRDPHHRPSEADDSEEPVPGLLAGGPNPGQQDKANCGDAYGEEHRHPATSYIDDRCSYASNEIAINWNAPFVYLANAIEALK